MRRRGGNGQVRIEDVARWAGVSPITVSRALRTPDKVSKDTREKVDEAVRAVGYVPNLLSARSDAQRRGFEAGLAEIGLQVEPSLETEGVSDVASGANAIVELLDKCPDVDAVFFAANSAAVGASLECRRRGWTVPVRIAIACFDNA